MIIEIVNLGNVNKQLQNLSNCKILWNNLKLNREIGFEYLYKKNKCLVQRRSKGSIFKGVCRNSQKQVIIRKINTQICNADYDDGVPTSILREISYLKTLNHQNIIKFVDVEVKCNSKNITIITECMEMNLKQYQKIFLSPKLFQDKISITNNKHQITKQNNNKANYNYILPLNNLKFITYQILQGLNYLHHNGFIHRNIKMENIVIQQKSMLVKITDFGLSKFIQLPHGSYTPENPKDREMSKRESKRLWYRAPEMLLRKSVYSQEIDMWSFGCLLAELAINEPIFSGENEIEQLFQIFRLLGSPTQDNWEKISDEKSSCFIFPKWKNYDLNIICQDKNSLQYQQFLQDFQKCRSSALKKLIKLKNVLGNEGIDLLQQLIQFDPKQRLSAEGAMGHKFFSNIKENEEKRKYYQETLRQNNIEKQYNFNKQQLFMCDTNDQNQNLDLVQKNTNNNKNDKNIQLQINVQQNLPVLLPANQIRCKNGSMCYNLNNLKIPQCHFKVIFENKLKQEKNLIKIENYFQNKQKGLNEQQRKILVDWLIDVSIHFDISNETLHLAILYIDHSLSRMGKEISKQNLQLLGVSCMKIADSYNEKSKEYYKQESSKEYAYITADQYSIQQVISMEKQILNALNFQLQIPTTVYFIQLIQQIINFGDTIILLANIIAEHLQVSFQFNQYNCSILASVCLFLSFQIQENTFSDQQKEQIKEYGDLLRLGLNLEQFEKIVLEINEIWYDLIINMFQDKLKSIFKKYQNSQIDYSVIMPPNITTENIKNNWFYNY